MCFPGVVGTYIILYRPIPELALEYLQDLATPPSLLAVGIISVMIGPHFAQSIFKVVGSRTWVAGRDCDGGRRGDGVRVEWRILFEGDDGHGAGELDAAFAYEVGEDAGGVEVFQREGRVKV